MSTPLVELEDLLDVVFDGIVVEEEVFNQEYGALFGSVIHLFKDVPGPLENICDLKVEIQDLESNSDAQQELVSYVESKVSSIASGSALDLLYAGLHVVSSLLVLIENVVALKKLF